MPWAGASITGSRLDVARAREVGSYRWPGPFSYARRTSDQRRRRIVNIDLDKLLAQIRAGAIPDNMPVTKRLMGFMRGRPKPASDDLAQFIQEVVGTTVLLEARIAALETVTKQDADLRDALSQIFPEWK
jgi:hypothetical protein